MEIGLKLEKLFFLASLKSLFFNDNMRSDRGYEYSESWTGF